MSIKFTATDEITTTEVHHVWLMVGDMARSCSFYTDLLGFTLVVKSPSGVVLSNGRMLLGLSSAVDAGCSHGNHHAGHPAVGLSHISFGVANRAELNKAILLFEEHCVDHGIIKDIPYLGITVLDFRDPDHIELELTAPLV